MPPLRPTRIATLVLVLLALPALLWAISPGAAEDGPPAARAHTPPGPVIDRPARSDAREPRDSEPKRAPAAAAPKVSKPPPARQRRPKRPRPAAERKRDPEPVTARSARRPLPPAGTVRGSIARSRRSGAIAAPDAARYRRVWSRARKVRAADVVGAAAVVRRLAQGRKLRPDRMPVLFLQLRRNVQALAGGRRPAAGERFTFGRDPVIFQYIPGQGLQFHPLANFAEANRLRNACVGYRTAPGVPCRKRRLARLADRLAALAVERAGFTTWEYYFDFTGGRAPWISGMAQATGMQALSRAGKLLKQRRYVRLARTARGAFERPAPAGVRVAPGNYAMYSFAPQLVVFNGLLQTVSGLHDYAAISGDRRGRRLFGAGDRLARRLIPSFDTGRWSLYSRPGGRATRDYHRLTAVFLGNLCERTERRGYCNAERRFRDYL